MTVTLPADLQAFVDERVKAGRWPDANAALAEAVRVLQQQEAEDEPNRADLLALLDEAEADVVAGRVAPLDAKAILAEVRAARAGRGKPE